MKIVETRLAYPAVAILGAVTEMQIGYVPAESRPTELAMIVVVLGIRRLPWLMHHGYAHQETLLTMQPPVILH